MRTEHDTHQQARVRGFSLIEMILYIALFSILVGALILAASTILSTYARMQASQDVAQAGLVSLDLLTREIRAAYRIDNAASTLGSTPGTLVLETTDTSGTPTTLTFALTSGRLVYREGAHAFTPLTHDDVLVTEAIFTRKVSPYHEAVQIELTLQKTRYGMTATKSFRTFVILDAS